VKKRVVVLLLLVSLGVVVGIHTGNVRNELHTGVSSPDPDPDVLSSPQGVVVGIIKDMAAHPKDKNLHVITVSDGGFGSASVVTNAKNIAVGLRVPPPTSCVHPNISFCVSSSFIYIPINGPIPCLS
jgi:hypothetical protein